MAVLDDFNQCKQFKYYLINRGASVLQELVESGRKYTQHDPVIQVDDCEFCQRETFLLAELLIVLVVVRSPRRRRRLQRIRIRARRLLSVAYGAD